MSNWKLMENGREVVLPTQCNDFRGVLWNIVDAAPPKHAGSSGRVFCTNPKNIHSDMTAEFFPSVFGMKWVQE